MSHLFLVVAMAVSLWPVGFIGWSFTTDTEPKSSDQAGFSDNADDFEPSDDFEDDDSSGEDPEPVDRAPRITEPDCTELARLFRRGQRLNRRFDEVELVAGVPLPDLAADAQAHVDDYRRWLIDNRRTYDALRDFARRDRKVSESMAALARSPTESALEDFNAAVRSYNRSSGAINDYC